MPFSFSKSFVVVLLLMALASCDRKQESASETNATAEAEPARVTVTVTKMGYEPSEVSARAGQPLTLAFKRTTDEGCGEKVVFPDKGIERDLPLNQEVEVELTPQKNERIAFACGMNMYRGSIVATH